MADEYYCLFTDQPNVRCEHTACQVEHLWSDFARDVCAQNRERIEADVARVLPGRWMQPLPAEETTVVPHDTYHRILHRLRQQHGDALMQETVELLRGGEGDVLGRPAHEPSGFERARGVLAADLEAAWAALPELQAIGAAALRHALLGVSCGVVGHAPDCECATL